MSKMFSLKSLLGNLEYPMVIMQNSLAVHCSPFYNTPHNNTDLDITWSCCGSHIFLPWNFYKRQIIPL